MDSTVSISKGVFVFKNGIKPSSQKRRKTKQKNETKPSIFDDQLWYQTYSNLWCKVEKKIQDLNNDMFACVLSNLVSFVKTSYENAVNEVPTAALLTGINMPDHAAQFTTLAKEIKRYISPHVVCLSPQDCQNLKQLVENVVNAFVNKTCESSDESEVSDSEDDKAKIKKSQCGITLLQAWYNNLYLNESEQKSPKKRKTKSERKSLVVIIPDFESFNDKVLQNFILIISSYINVLPFVLVFGIATSLTALHRSLPYHVSSKINIQVFNSQQSTMYLNNVLEHVFFENDFPFHLGGKVFTLFTDIFLFYDLSVTGFIKNYKYAMLEHFSYGNAMSLCTNFKNLAKLLDTFSHEDFENVRHLMSFRRLVENESPMNQIKLLTDDDYFKAVLLQEIEKIHKYTRNLHIFLKCLHVLTRDLPKTPLGKQIRELYGLTTSKSITNTEEFKHSFQLLGFQSKDELSDKISKIEDIISFELRQKSSGENGELESFLKELRVYTNNLITVGVNEDEDEKVEKENDELAFTGKMDRKKLKDTLMQMSKKSKRLNKYEKLRQELLEYLTDNFKRYLREPSAYNFHEIYFFNDLSIQNHIVGVHRAAIHTALNDPCYYLQCSCCEISNDSSILRTMPDICVAYKLHLEGGKMINLYDWLQAFLSVVDPIEADDDEEEKRVVQPQMQARFTQAVAELEFLGFIKSSKRKTDHVARLTWGG